MDDETKRFLQELEARLESRLDGLEIVMKQRFDRIETRLDSISDKVGQINEILTETKNHLDRMVKVK